MSFDNCYDKTRPSMLSADWLLGFYNAIKEDPIEYIAVTLPQKSTLLHFSDKTRCTWYHHIIPPRTLWPKDDT